MPAIDPVLALEELETSLKRETIHIATTQLLRIPAPHLSRVEPSWPTLVYRHFRHWRRRMGG